MATPILPTPILPNILPAYSYNSSTLSHLISHHNFSPTHNPSDFPHPILLHLNIPHSHHLSDGIPHTHTNHIYLNHGIPI